MNEEKRIEIEGNIVRLLKTVFDPEIPVDIYSLGLIYAIDVDDDGVVHIDMTLTAPTCPASDFLMEDIKMKLESIDGVTGVDVRIVFEPEWSQDMMTDEAKLELGLL
ncbi:MAG: iron-sulfur cluster assembly protein [Bacteroidales bacterium]|nr:iron-sulfur cluster assembly protein [Bacteroidales bacterium]